MYQPRTPNYRKRDPHMRWGLPDRVFFACGACHILAYAFLERYDDGAMEALWIRPDDRFTGNHIVVALGDRVFDYHGYSERRFFMERYWDRARRRYSGWDGSIRPLPRPVLVSEPLSRTYDGLWLRQPDQFLHDALPRAEAYLTRFPAPHVMTTSSGGSSVATA